jgi:hypothetical protein
MTASPEYVKTFSLATHLSCPPLPSPTGRDFSFKVKYADYRYRNEDNPKQERLFFLLRSLFGSQLVHIGEDELATKHNIRIIHQDRPRTGGTDLLMGTEYESLET